MKKIFLTFILIVVLSFYKDSTTIKAQTIPPTKLYIATIVSKFDESYYFSQRGYGISNWNNSKIIFVEGVPKVNYGGTIGIQTNYTTVAQYGLSLYNLYLDTKDEKVLNEFYKQVDFIENGGTNLNSNTIVYQYGFDDASYKLKAGWVSSIAQGNVLSILARAYKLDRNSKHLEISRKVYNGMILSVENGGTYRKTSDGFIWFEEAPSEKESLILNGFMYAVIGIYDYADISKDESVLNVFKESLKSFDRTISYYDTGTWILYDRMFKRKVSKGYIAIHARCAEHFYEITKDEYYLNLANKWFNYIK